VHARAVVAEHRLSHEGGRFAVGVGDVVDHVLVELESVSHHDPGVELQTQLVLGRGHFVVMLFGLHAQLAHDGQHFAAQVLRRVYGIDGEIAALCAWAVAHIAFGIGPAGIGRQFAGIIGIAGIVRIG